MRTAEAQLVAETRRDPVAVEEAFATHYSAVFRQVQRLMRDPDDSYDLTLTAWEKAQRAWDRRPSVALEIKPCCSASHGTRASTSSGDASSCVGSHSRAPAGGETPSQAN